MRGFYLATIGVVVALSLSPFVMLKKTDLGRFAGKVVSYNSYGSKVRSVDPATCGDTTSASIQGNFYEGLYAYHFLKRPVEVIPQLAAAMPEVSPDHLTYTIRLREDIKYARNPCFGIEADGRPKTRNVRARDFVLSFKRIADFHITAELSWTLVGDRIAGLKEYREKTRSYERGDFSRYDLPLEGVQAVDAATLRIRLKAPFPQLLYVLAMAMYAPIPRELVDYHLTQRHEDRGESIPIPLAERSPEIHDPRAVVGTGPYVLTEWVAGSKIVMERNPDFRHEVYPSEGAPGDRQAGLLADAGKRVPFVDVRHLVFVAESNPAWMLFLSRQSDSSSIPRDVYDSVISPSRELTDKWRQRGIRLVKAMDPAIYWYGFNLDDKVLGKSKALRQALCLAYDVEKHIDVLYNGRGKRAVNMVPSSFEGHDAAGPGPYSRLDLDQARAKLTQAKKELVAAGVIEAGEDIPPLTLDTGSTDESARRMAEFAQQQFGQIGVTLKVEMNDWPTLQDKVHNKQCQLYTMGWHADYADPENFLQNYYSPNIKKGTNSTNYSNPRFDRLYEETAVMTPSPKRTALYVEMIRILSEDCPVLLLSEPVTFILVNDWVHNIKRHPIGYGFGKYTRIDVAARRRAGGR